MAVPRFGYFPHEPIACVLMFLSGAVGLVSTLMGRAEWVQSWLQWATWSPDRSWLLAQSAAVMVGGVGAFSGSATLALVGVVAALVYKTPVGAIAVGPGLFMLLSVTLRWRSFDDTSAYRGPGPPPPG